MFRLLMQPQCVYMQPRRSVLAVGLPKQVESGLAPLSCTRQNVDCTAALHSEVRALCQISLPDQFDGSSIFGTVALPLTWTPCFRPRPP
ncbi:hypothetical protein VFPPC_16491 [Pochonia chlamydosporia 170]|uniref:Uncharacterized protein n=1 Tax=Pochonia chlamydosporia 170 TaxID=1380566 RepID=A0A179FDX3_METCM|nr:hypothetical protein VFPPC_16491 [Pochonia chlamydosporia 170]OAQ63587.1 hypothetical protein VFPPC_16491 [Pochonia chlamydosporia 170]